ncbi:thioredoxin-disulfide reductase [bacterium]|nr:thioredoxin-disulfide reductase [bacterium]
MSEHVPVLIAGSGCAGHTAAIYAARADLKPLVLEGNEPGGQLSLTSDVENFPGFPEGINGFDLVENMKKQAQRFGARYQYGFISKVEPGSPLRCTTDGGEVITCDALIVASGARARRLNVPGEDELFGRGVSSCATCDGAFYRDMEIAVVGGGDSACEEALFLTRFASKVHLLHRRDSLRASKIMQDRTLSHEKIQVHWNTVVESVHGSPEKGVEYLQLQKDGKPEQLKISGLFLGIGHIPNTEFLRGVCELDEEGYLVTQLGKTNGENVKTNVPGIFGCGDVVDKRYRQAITAAGMGCKAAMDAEHMLAERKAEAVAGH